MPVNNGFKYNSGNVTWICTISSSTVILTAGAVLQNLSADTIEIPNYVVGTGITYPVVAIGDNVINGGNFAQHVKTITFQSPCNITSIGSQFANNLPNLTSCDIPDSVTSIGSQLCGGSGASTLLLTISKNIAVNTTNLSGLLASSPATTIRLFTPLLQDDSYVTGAKLFESTTNLRNLYIVSSAGTNQPITFVQTSPGQGPWPFQYLDNTIYGTLYLTPAIINDTLFGGITGINQGIAGVPDTWTIASFGETVPCFPAGTRILTAVGYKAVETLQQQDLVVTSDGRQVPVKIYGKRINKTNTTSAPYLIPANALGPKIPIHDIRLSPDHAFQIRKGVWMMPHRAATLSDKVVQYGVGEPVTYFHLECPHYSRDNLVTEGVIVESYAAGQTSFKSPYKYNERIRGYTRETLSVPMKKV